MSSKTSSQKLWPAKLLRSFEPWDYVRMSVGLVLLTAAGLKAWQVLFDPASLVLQTGVLSSKWVVIAIVDAEMFLGVCLLMNVCRRTVWIATVVMFSSFVLYSAMQIIRGAISLVRLIRRYFELDRAEFSGNWSW